MIKFYSKWQQSCSSFSAPMILSAVLAVTILYLCTGAFAGGDSQKGGGFMPYPATAYDGVTVSASIGICYFPEHGRDFDKLVHLADVAAYVVKERGKGGYHVYEPGDKI